MKFSFSRSSLILTSLVVAVSLSAGMALAEDKSGEGGKGRHPRGKMFEHLDVNKDGKITKEEARQMSDERFKKVDTNSDGVITQDEAKAVHEKMRAKHAEKHGDKDGPKHRKHGPRGPGHLFAKMDTNKDGKITRAEAQKVADEHFAKMDANKDGAVTREEAILAHKARMKERHEQKGGDKKSASKSDVNPGTPAGHKAHGQNPGSDKQKHPRSA